MSASPVARITDFSRDTRPARAPTASTGDQGPFVSSVPVPLGPLIGREREAGVINDLLGPEGVRLLTLVGPGGVGKTRLALHVAAGQQAAHPDRPVVFIALAGIVDPDLVIPTIAQTLGVQEGSQRSPQERLVAALSGSDLLLVLDNWEQVLAAAPALAEVLARCPGLRVLATSRTPLGLSGERVIRVEPLTLPEFTFDPTRPEPVTPDLTDLLASEAVRLFVDRAQAVRADFCLTERNAAEVATICQRLDGLPLAIELAAARVRHAPPGNLLARLDRRLPILTGGPRDQPPRLQTMRDAIGWSHDLLSAEERIVFRRLAVFAGGATLEAAEAVCDPHGELRLSVWEAVSTLVDQSLLLQRDGEDGEPRFEMLQTVREFALDHLELAGDAAETHCRHAQYLLELVRPFASSLTFERGEVHRLLARMKAELNNLRAVLDWCDQAREVELALELTGTLMMFWYYHGHLSEGAARVERALAAAAGVEVPPLVRARALVCQGLLALTRGDAALGLTALAEGARLREFGGDEAGALVAHDLRGGILVSEGRYEEAAPIFERNLPRLRELNIPIWAAHALFHLGAIAFARGERVEAATLCEEAANLYGATSRLDATDPLRYLGLIACAEGDVDRAARWFAETLALLGERDSVAAFSTGLADVGTLAIARGMANEAATLFGAADALRQAHEASYSLPARDVYEAAMARTQDALGADLNESARAAGSRLSLAEALAIADTVLHPDTANRAAPAAPEHQDTLLTPREHEVLVLMAAGLTNPEIGDRLFISRGTARTHVSNILAKLGARTRTEAVALAREQGLLRG